jgi:hypothetical protein
MAKQGKGSKNKGAEFERKVAKIFGKHFFQNPKALIRSPRSGGGSWKGDIVPNPEFPNVKFDFCIECKKQEKWDFTSVFKNFGESLLCKFWIQTLRECPKDKIPILVFSKNNSPIFVLTKWSMDSSTSSHFYIDCKSYTSYLEESVVITTLVDFLKEIH